MKAKIEERPRRASHVPAHSRVRTRARSTLVSVAGVLGELALTAGVIVLLYLGWQLWIGDLIYEPERSSKGMELSEQWAQDFGTPSGTPDAVVSPVIRPEPADAERFGVLHVPRFGSDYAVPIAGGVSRARTLDPIGVGHYPGTSMPGELGNFAIAAHRTTWGKPFNRIADLKVGDAIVVETADGWYTYRFRTLEYVTPDDAQVLLPVPEQLDVIPTVGYITLTSCSPMYSMSERIIAYGVFDTFTPRSAGEPASLDERTS